MKIPIRFFIVTHRPLTRGHHMNLKIVLVAIFLLFLVSTSNGKGYHLYYSSSYSNTDG